METLNWNKNKDDIKTALMLLDDYSEATWNNFEKATKAPSGAIAILGAKGFNQYFIQPNGNIGFSRANAMNKKATDEAAELGFSIL